MEIRILGAPSRPYPLQDCYPKVFFSNCLRTTAQGWHSLFLIFHVQPLDPIDSASVKPLILLQFHGTAQRFPRKLLSNCPRPLLVSLTPYLPSLSYPFATARDAFPKGKLGQVMPLFKTPQCQYKIQLLVVVHKAFHGWVPSNPFSPIAVPSCPLNLSSCLWNHLLLVHDTSNVSCFDQPCLISHKQCWCFSWVLPIGPSEAICHSTCTYTVPSLLWMDLSVSLTQTPRGRNCNFFFFVVLSQSLMMAESNRWIKERLSDWLHKLMNEGRDDEWMAQWFSYSKGQPGFCIEVESTLWSWAFTEQGCQASVLRNLGFMGCLVA